MRVPLSLTKNHQVGPACLGLNLGYDVGGSIGGRKHIGEKEDGDAGWDAGRMDVVPATIIKRISLLGRRERRRTIRRD